MTLAEWVLAALLTLPVSKHDRALDPATKRQQLETIADAIVDASEYSRWGGTRKELAALLVTVGYHESAYALHVHAGMCKPTECDGGRARGIWQQQIASTSSPDAWHRIVGLDIDSTRLAAREAARALSRARGACRRFASPGPTPHGWAEMTFNAYAGRGCLRAFHGAKARVSSLRRLLEL